MQCVNSVLAEFWWKLKYCLHPVLRTVCRLDILWQVEIVTPLLLCSCTSWVLKDDFLWSFDMLADCGQVGPTSGYTVSLTWTYLLTCKRCFMSLLMALSHASGLGLSGLRYREDDEAGVSAHLSSSIMPRHTSTVWCCLVLLSLGDLSLQQFGVALPWWLSLPWVTRDWLSLNAWARACFPLVIESALGNLGLALSMHGHVLEQAENCGPKSCKFLESWG
jgi:hypothetical protein